MVTQQLTWGELKHRAIDAFNGELPNADTEQAILDAFTLEPVAVLHTLDAVTDSYRAGKARSGWAVWKSRIATATNTAQIAIDIDDRPKQIRLAELWIRNAGGYLDRPEELEDALFGDTGRLHPWHDDQALIDRMHARWHEQRHRFVQAELEAEARQQANAATLRRLRRSIGTALPPDEAAKHAARIAAEVQRAREAAERVEYLATVAPEDDYEPAWPDPDPKETP